MAPATHDPISATAINPAPCGVCPKLASITCSGCDNMQYCSDRCLQVDSVQHSMLCGAFKDFQSRPSDNHYRSIYFPPNEDKARFIWLQFTGSRGGQNVDSKDLARYVAGRPSGRLTVTSHPDIKGRDYKNFMVIEHDDDMFANQQPVNQCLFQAIGSHANRWRGDYVVHAFKYLYSDDMDTYHAKDADLNPDDFPLIALDLDTTSLGPLIAYLSWHARNERGGQGFF